MASVRWRPMVPRVTTEEHRASTPLELLFDLCFVVAVSQASGQLQHAIGEGNTGEGLLGYAMVFFGIWWAWMNFSWFASAYDTDDVLYRVMTLVQMAGVLVLAAGVPRAFARHDFVVVAVGYLIMRVPMIGQWLRAAHGNPDGRATAYRYAIGIGVVQACWLARLALPATPGAIAFGVLLAAELTVPVWAERHGFTTWHPEHIAERYGLFVIIVLGESILGATNAVQSGLDAGHSTAKVLMIAGGGVLIVFTMWWLYFEQPADRMLEATRDNIAQSVTWGYGHFFIFASAAAVGSGLEGAIAQATGAAHHLSARGATLAVAVPVAGYLVALWGFHVRPHHHGALIAAWYPAGAALAVLIALAGLPILAVGILMALLLAIWLVAVSRLSVFDSRAEHDHVRELEE